MKTLIEYKHINLPHLTGIKDYKKIQNRTINWVRVKAKTKEHHRQTKFIKDTKIYSSTSQNKAKRIKKIFFNKDRLRGNRCQFATVVELC